MCREKDVWLQGSQTWPACLLTTGLLRWVYTAHNGGQDGRRGVFRSVPAVHG